jgi:hypothetical protein
MVHRINLVAEVFESADLETYLCFRRKVFHLPTIQNGLIYARRKIELNSPSNKTYRDLPEASFSSILRRNKHFSLQ